MSSTTTTTRPFYIGLIVLILALSAAFLVANGATEYSLTPWRFWVSIGAFALISVLAYRLQSAAIGGRPAQLSNRFMGATFLKLFLAVILFLVMVITCPRAEAIIYTVVFLVLYVIFTVYISIHSNRLNAGTET